MHEKQGKLFTNLRLIILTHISIIVINNIAHIIYKTHKLIQTKCINFNLII
jgi:hypothetical protein